MRIAVINNIKVLVEVLNDDLNDGVFIVPYDVPVVGRRAFCHCDKLTRVEMPKVTTIENCAFDGCASLTHANMPNATTIGDYAFFGCASLIHAEMHSTTTIGLGAFNMCASLTHANIPSATTIGDYAFTDCAALTCVVISPALTFDDRVVAPFFDCPALSHIIIDSDIDKDVERIKKLFPSALKRYVLSKSLAVQQQVLEPESPPVPTKQAREAQEHNALLYRIDRILDGLWSKIEGADGVPIGTHYRGASQAATGLHFALVQARNSLKTALESGASKELAISEFRGKCEELVAQALPELERDKNLCRYLCDMLKYLANLFIGAAQKLGSRATFFNTSSESSQSITQSKQELVSVGMYVV